MGWAIFVLKWLFAYLLGGISFVTLLLSAGWFLIFVYGSKPIGDIDLRKRDRLLLEQSAFKETEKHAEDDDDDNSFIPIIEGWLTVRRQFQSPDQSQQGQMMNHAAPDAVDNINGHHNPSKLSYSTRIAQAYRTVKAAGAASSANQTPKDMFWVQLKGSLLFIYQAKEQFKSQVTVGGGKPKDEHIEPLVALPLPRYRLTMETRHGTAGLTEGKLFSKRTAMVLRLVDTKSSKKEGLHMLAKGMSSSDNAMTLDEEVAPWFIQCKSPVVAEDWYLKLLVKTYDHPTTKRVWSNEHMLWLMKKVQSPDQEVPDSSNLDWLNAFIGRIFLGVTHTALVEQAIIHRINRKLATIQHPLIGPLVATEVNLGHIPPTFSNVKLKDLMGNGTVAFHAHMDYRQPEGLEGNGIRITIEATKLGFKAVLAVVVKSLSSDVQVMIKAPPSDRIWWAFTRPPKMDMVIEPVLGARQINWNFILGFIEKKMREGIAESVVLPNMDDVPFFTTMEMPIRGGIFDSASRGWTDQHKSEEKESVSEDSSSVKSAKSDKSVKSAQTTHTFQTSKTTATASSHKSDGLRYRNHTLAHAPHDDAGPEKAGIQRAETSPALNTQAPPKQTGSNFKMFGSRPSSVRTESAATTSTSATTSTETMRSASFSEAPKPRSGSGDSTPASSGFELQPSSTVDSRKSSFTESWKPSAPLAKSSLAQGNASILEKNRASLAKGSTLSLEKNLGSLAQGQGHTSLVEACETETARSLTPTKRDELSRTIDPSKSPKSQPSLEVATPSLTPAATAAVTTASLITAVRARDKAGLQSQAVVAKEGLKKWGVNFMNKRRAGTQPDDDDEHGHAPAPGYYAPSAEEREHSHQPRTSLQERLNAAAQAKRESAGSPGSAPLPERPFTTSPGPNSSPAPAGARTETPVKGALNAIPAPSKGALNTVAAKSGSSIARPLPRPVRTETEAQDSQSPNVCTSPPTFSPPPAARMVVPSVPKRAGVVTSIGHDPTPAPNMSSKSADAPDQATTTSKPRSTSNASAASGKESWLESGKAALAGLKAEPPARAESTRVPTTESASTMVADLTLDNANTPVASVTPTSVTTRTAAADGASPARESLLGHVRSASGSSGGGNATTSNAVNSSNRNDNVTSNGPTED